MNDLYQIIIEGIKHAQRIGKIPAFAYDRISDKVQSDGLSLDYQESYAIQYAERNNIHIVNFFTIIESAKAAGRKVFNQMIDLALQFGIKDLIFKNTDRMSRNYHDLLRIEELYEKKDFSIHFYQTYRILNSKSTYADRFIMAVEIAAARQLSDKLSHDTKQNQHFKANQGIAPLGSPLGYIYNKKDKKHFIDKTKENFVCFFFDGLDNGKLSLEEFADFLNGKGYKTSKGYKWHKSNVHYMATNVFYHGEFYFAGKIWSGNHEPYYNKERYEKRMERFKLNLSGHKIKEHDFALRKFVKCECGRTLIGDLKKGKYIYYSHRCLNNEMPEYIPEHEIYTRVDAGIKDIEFDIQFGNFLKEMFAESVQIKREDSSKSVAALSRQISELEIKQDKLFDLLIDDEIDKSALKRKLDQIRKDIDRLENEKKLLKVNKNDFILKASEVIDNMRELPVTYKFTDYDKRIALIRSMAEYIILTKEKALFQWKKPYSFILSPEILKYRDVVRAGTVMLPQLDEARTVIFNQSILFQLWLAA